MNIPLANTPWLMEPERLQAMHERLRRLQQWPTQEQLEAARQVQAKGLRRVAGRIGILPVHGIIEQRMSAYGYHYGGFSTELGELRLKELLANKEVDAILMDIDSPGGTSYGVEELGDLIYKAREQKPVIAVANSYAASAAYWLATAATSLIVSPGGDVGSVGVYIMHVDWTDALAAEGIKVTIVRSGKYKADPNPVEPLTDEARDWLQELCDDCYTKFTKAVARNRGVSTQVVREKFGQGRTVVAAKALEAKMVDGVASMGHVLEKLTGGGSTDGKRAGNAEVLRLRHEQRKRESVSSSTPAGCCCR